MTALKEKASKEIDKENLKPVIDKDHKEGQQIVSLSKIRTDYYKNYRSSMSIDGMEQLMEAIESNGQLQNVVGTWLSDGTVAITAGFRRVEAIRRLTLKELISKYNKENKLQPKDEQYIAFFKGHNWLDRTIEAMPKDALELLDGCDVKVDIVKIENEVDAWMLNGVENEAREDASLKDLLELITRLKDNKVSQERIAKGLVKNKVTISQLANIAKLPQKIRSVLYSDDCIDELGLKNKKELEGHKIFVENLLEEMEKRISEPKTAPRCIKFSHLRELSNALSTQKSKLPNLNARCLIMCLKQLCTYTTKFLGNPTPEFPTFKNYLDDQMKLTQTMRKESELEAAGIKVEKSEGESKEHDDERDDDNDSITLEELRKKQRELKAKASETSLDELADVEDDFLDDGDKSPTVKELSEIDRLIDEDDGLSVSSDDDDELDEYVDIEDEDEDEEITHGEAAITASKTKEMDKPGSKYKVKSPEDTEKLASMMLDIAKEDDTSLVERIACLYAAIYLYDSIGLEDNRKELDLVYEEYSNEITNWINKSLKAVNEYRNNCEDKETKNSLKELSNLPDFKMEI